MAGLGGGTFRMIIVGICLILFETETKAMPCTIGQEPDPQTGRYRWLIQAVDPCECTAIGMGGLNTFVPYRPYKVTYYDTFLISSDPEEIKKWLNCSGDFSCPKEGPLGMEDGRIPDDSITASSYWENRVNFESEAYLSEDFFLKPRLFVRQEFSNNFTAGSKTTLGAQIAAAWCSADNFDGISPWIQVEFSSKVTITGLITQGRGDADQWVKEYNVTYSDDGQSWNDMTYAKNMAIKFPGNEDRNTPVTTRFPVALCTRILRTHPTAWEWHCSMRFEVIGCY